MKRIIVFAIAWIVFSPGIALSQTRARTTTKRRPRPVTTSRSAVQARTEGATKVAEQIKILTRFIYLFRGVTKEIEATDAAARRNESSRDMIALSERSKASVTNSLQNVRDGLDKLELDFRTTPGLERYYPDLVGVAAAAATAEEQAARNEFDQAGRTLLGVVNHLTDVLLFMR